MYDRRRGGLRAMVASSKQNGADRKARAVRKATDREAQFQVLVVALPPSEKGQLYSSKLNQLTVHSANG